MPTAIKRPAKSKPSLKRMSAELAQLRARVEDLEDARALDKAIAENGKKPLIPWAQAKKQLGLL
ncbi:MAG: hypothetical protein QG602_2764 [Verrucomicrobiota bacterium]|nr:hypothetical protein [Verrucomicrobiota bacterium]